MELSKRVALDEGTMKIIRHLKERTGVKTSNAIVADSISLLHWAAEQVKAGKRIAAAYDGKLEFITTPILERYRIND